MVIFNQFDKYRTQRVLEYIFLSLCSLSVPTLEEARHFSTRIETPLFSLFFFQTDIQKYCPLQLLYAEKNSKEKNALQTLNILVKKVVLSIFQKLQEKFGSESYPSNNQGLRSAESLKKNPTTNFFLKSHLRRIFLAIFLQTANP